MDIYTALFDSRCSEVLKTFFATADKDLEKMLAPYPEIYFGGSAALKCKEILTLPQFHFVDAIDCDSRLMAGVAEKKFAA